MECFDHVISTLGWKIPQVTSAGELIELAKRVDTAALEAETGLRTEPPFPGALETPERMPNGWRMISACRLFSGVHEMGVIFMTFYSGRTVSIVINPPGTAIPAEYSPIRSR